jgi:ABC-type transport system involved in multi-copper enzyme maturation permease subunit
VVAALLAAMTTIAVSYTSDFGETPAQRYARLGQSYFYALIGVELALVMLAAPAATAGAICLDRARGTLAHVMATDLTDPEIVLGKLAARLVPVMALVAGTWPVMAICTLLGGIDPAALAMAMAIIVTVALLGCALALALSVWARRPHEVILTAYTFWIAMLMAWPIWFAFSSAGIRSFPGQWLLLLNPFYLAFAPYTIPGRLDLWDYVWVLGGALVCSATLVWLAVWKMRPVACRMAGKASRDPALGLAARLRRWLPGPSLERNPVLWREWHRARASAWMTWLVVLLGGSTGLACVVGAIAVWRKGVIAFGPGGPAQMAGVMGYMLQVVLGLLMLSAVAPLSLSEERQRGSLDVLNATPLSAWAIVLAKWWGTFRIVPVLALAPGLMGCALATARWAAPPPAWAAQTAPIGMGYRVGGAAMIVATILAHGAVLTSIGLALATWTKRQTRAIAGSVCAFVLIAVALPILMTIIFSGEFGQGLASLSPIAVLGEMADQLTMRMPRLPKLLWWIGFWDVSIAALAIGLLWLTGRTFDVAFGRILERPRTSPLASDSLLALGAISAIPCLYVAFTFWVEGVDPHSLRQPEDVGVSVYVALVALSLLALSAIAPLSVRFALRDHSLRATRSDPDSSSALLMRLWWRIFRLAPLQALGPGMVALALATAPTAEPGEGRVAARVFPPGARTSRAVPIAPQRLPSWEVPLSDRLRAATALVSMMLAHSAAIASLGLTVGTKVKRKGLAIAASVGSVATISVIGPLILALVIAVTFHDHTLAALVSTPSPVAVSGYLMAVLLSREGTTDGFIESALFCNFAVATLAVAWLWHMIRSAELHASRARAVNQSPFVDALPAHRADDAILVRS